MSLKKIHPFHLASLGLILVLIALLFVACNSNVTDNTRPVEQIAQEEIETDPIEQSAIQVADSNDYSMTFLTNLEASGVSGVLLNNNELIFETGDVATFPSVPALNKKVALTAKEGELAVALIVERINQSTIDYKIEMVEFGNASYNSSGKAHLSPHFYFGSETDENSYSGVSYFSTEYSEIVDSCFTYIRLGYDEDSNTQMLGKLIKNCNGELKNLELDNYPSLMEK